MAGDIRASYRTYLLTKTAVTDLVSQRIYYNNLPQGVTLPAVVLSIDSHESHRHMTGASGLADTTISVDVHAQSATSSTDAYTIAEAIRKNTETFKGTAGSDYVQKIFCSPITEVDFPPADGSDSWRKGRTMDVRIWWHEPAVSI